MLDCIPLCAEVLCCALLCSRFNDNIYTRTYYVLLYCSAVEQWLYTGTSVPPATLARKEACIDITDRCKVDGPTFSVQTGDLPMPRALCSRKTNGTQHACTYVCFFVRTLIGTDLVCCLVQGGLRCALLCSRFNDIHTRTYCGTAVCCCIRIYRSRMFVAAQKTMENKDSSCIKCSRTCMLDLANSARLLALSSGMHERENSAKHGTARHRTKGTTPHGTARRCAAPLS